MRLILTTLTVLLLAPASALGAAAWRAPETITGVGEGVGLGAPDVAVDERGTAVAAWTTHRRGRSEVRAARASRSGPFGRDVLVRGQRSSIDDARVAFDEDRNAIVVYRRFERGNHRVAARTLRPSGRLSTEQLLSGGGPSAFEPVFARTAGDAPIVAWRRSSDRADTLTVELAAAGAGGRFERRVTFELPDAPQAFVVAGGPEDERYLATVRRVEDSARGRVIVGIPRGGTTTDLDLQPVSGDERPIREIALAVTRAGRIVAAWTENHGGRQAIMVADRPRGGRFGPPRQLLAPDRYVDGLTLVATGEDTVRAAWVSAASRSPVRLRRGILATARLGVGGDDGPPRDISRPGADLEGYVLATDGRGGFTALWQRDARAEPGGPLEARAITAQGRFGRIQRVTARGERAVGAALGVGERGDARAVWATSGGRLRAARRPG